ncbi:MAG TPA: hypothetical protein VEC99_01465, partial [Clostridia bacterium]|nr:hypothetical protein [Clostridia bacterium]
MKRSEEFNLALSLLRDQVAGSHLLPGSYRKYQPLLADGLKFFLERLSSTRLKRILDEQLSLGFSVSIQKRVVALLHHVPALHKLGQVVARDRRLEAGFRKELQRLESLEARTPLDEVVALLNTEFPDWQPRGIVLGPKPLAEGSVAVVMPFQWDPKQSPSPSGVFKLLKPGIKSLLDEDLEILGKLGDYLDEDCERYHLPPLDYRDTFDTIRDLLMHEVLLREEQEHLAWASKFYASDPNV